MADAVVMPLADKARRRRAVFRGRAGAGLGGTAVSGRLAVVGLGPGDARWLTRGGGSGARRRRRALRLRPLSRSRCRRGRDRRATPPTTARKARAPRRRCGTRRRARRSPWSRAAIPACSPWRPRCARRSKPDRDAWRALDVAIVPGVTAMLAVAARVGAPLGHDFCAISLSDNLKPWELIERRLDAAAGAGFVIALYNPISRARPWQLGAAFERLRRRLPASTPVVFGRAVGRPDESVVVTTLAERRSGDGRHGDAGHRGLGGDARDRASRPRAARLHAAGGSKV